ncbi:MAG TPA: hypothetical protein VFD65_02875 [Chitinophagales bacterium]|nr:hypothetical protein [Chitinophagales bacterium]
MTTVYYKILLFVTSFLILTNIEGKKKVNQWTSYNDESKLPFESFYSIGFNYSHINDTIMEAWVTSELKKYYNNILSACAFELDSNNGFHYNKWVDSIRRLKVDAVVAYTITPYYYKLKKKEAYKPFLQEPYKSNFGSYLIYHSKLYPPLEQPHPTFIIELNIFEGNTLNLIWSGKSSPLTTNVLDKRTHKTFEKLIRIATKKEIVNSDSD